MRESEVDNKRKVKSKRIAVMLLFILAVVLVVGTSFALWRLTFRQTDTNTIATGCLKLTLTEETGAISLNEAVPMTDEEGKKLMPYTFTITNVCSTKTRYVVNLETVSDGEKILADNFIKANMLKDDTEVFLSKLTPEHENQEKVIKTAQAAYMLDQGNIDSNQTISYSLRLWLDSEASNLEDMMNAVFASKVTITASYIPKNNINQNLLYSIIEKQAVVDNMASEFVTSTMGIDFSVPASDTNGKGVYIIADTKDSKYPIHYFRGDVTNNNVKFANFCWKIVRTTETGGIKIVYNGPLDVNGNCVDTTLENIVRTEFNENFDSVDYVGYMYPKETNANDSKIKTEIDTWYQNNMKDYAKYLEDTVWCNDRSVYKVDGMLTYYGAYKRYIDLYKPSIECSNDNDKFTVNSKNGNGKLTYPVALLTIDEVVFAGNAYDGDNLDNYLIGDESWWVLSPSYFDNSVVRASEFYFHRSGSLASTGLYGNIGVRPSISLVPDVIVNGDGSQTSPYEIIS